MSTTKLTHSLVRASAGSGKTYCLSTNYLRLLEIGERPEHILATTFTRKAAGEIRARIFSRLAEATLYDDKTEEMAKALDSPGFNQARAAELFSQLIATQHRLAVSTIDSLFVSLARIFPLELDLGLNWKILEGHRESRIRSWAIAESMQQLDKEVFSGLFQLFLGGDTARSVSGRLSQELGKMYELYLLSPASSWKWSSKIQEQRPLSDKELIDSLEEFTPAITKSKSPDKRWLKALDKLRENCRDHAWSAILKSTLVVNAFSENGDPKFATHSISDENLKILRVVGHAAACYEIETLSNRTVSAYALLDLFHKQYFHKKQELGEFSFHDITHILSQKGLFGELQEVYYRLDCEYRHLLLDEFQDTSLQQWTVMRPLVEEILSDVQDSRLFFCVGDVKQSIYGWRGGVPELFDLLQSNYSNLLPESMEKSYRSSPEIVSLVNTIFDNLPENKALIDASNDCLLRAARSWHAGYTPHQTVREAHSGYVRYERITQFEEEKSAEEESIGDLDSHFISTVRSLAHQAKGISIAVLVRRNATAERLVSLLRGADSELSVRGESSAPLSTIFAAQELLALLKLIDHPDNTAAAYRISSSPLGEHLRFRDYQDRDTRHRLSNQLRVELFQVGYGRFLHLYAKPIVDKCNEQERKRLRQLVSAAYSFDSQGTVRTADFLAFLASAKLEEASSAQVRVMTIHKSKGLEFDAVILPDLKIDLISQITPQLISYSETPYSTPLRISRYARSEIREFCPELKEMKDQTDFSSAREALSTLYVAITRAREAVYLLDATSSKPANKLPATFSGLLRGAFGISAEDNKWEMGNPKWYQTIPAADEQLAPGPKELKSEDELHTRKTSLNLRQSLKTSTPSLTHKTPSALSHSNSPFAAYHLRANHKQGLLRGSLIHMLCESIDWISKEPPSDSELRQSIRKKIAPQELVEEVIRQFRNYLGQEEIKSCFTRSRYQGVKAEELTLYREFPFALREGEELFSGSIDRLVVCSQDGVAYSAEVIDFKTDRASEAELLEKAAHYSPQLESYQKIVSKIFSIPHEHCKANLVFLSSGKVIGV